MPQVVTIGPAGEISGLQRKPGQGIDLRQFGRASIERASEIVFDEGSQAWEVKVLTGPFAGEHLTFKRWCESGLTPAAGDAAGAMMAVHPPEREGRLQFDDYDNAVKAEIAFLDAMRVKGLF